jgi:2-iminobutanoate/2-iminopropanoate deaminase
VSALFGDNPLHHAIPEDARAEAEQIFDNLGDPRRRRRGADRRDAVGIVMRDLQRDRPVFNQVWAERFGEHRPARSAIQAPDFGRKGENARFMIEVAAYRGWPFARAGGVRTDSAFHSAEGVRLAATAGLA